MISAAAAVLCSHMSCRHPTKVVGTAENEMDLDFLSGCRPEHGVPDMTVISNIDENGINRNLRVRYDRDTIYVSSETSLER